MKETESLNRSEVKARRTLLASAGIGLVFLLSFFKTGLFRKKDTLIACAPPTEGKKTIKVLTQDGQLVEVDVSKIKTTKHKISNEELKNWIKKG